MNRNDFPMLNNNLIYFDNSATTFKPNSVINAINDYYTKYTANCHRGDYSISMKVEELYESTRSIVKDFINCDSTKEIIFTSGTTDSLNRCILGLRKILKKGDEVLITKTEHASNVLPWYYLAKEIGIVVKFIELDNGIVTIDNLKKSLTSNVKVVSLALITNTLGDIRPIKEITKICHENNILVICDGAQSTPHIKTDVKDLDVDFLCFSGHKILGPTGIGVLYGKQNLLDKLELNSLGGGMNSDFYSNITYDLKELPLKMEAGTQNIEGVLGLREAIKYLNNIGLDNIHKYELELRNYLVSELEKIDDVIIYNKNIESGIVLFNLKNIHSQDLAIYLDKHNICVRSGNHCVKMLHELINVSNTCRISLYFYNTKEEIDKFIEVMKNNKNIFKEIL